MTEKSAPSLDSDDPFSDRRAHPRVPVALPAFLQAEGERHSVQLLDLSAGGAKLNCTVGFPAGTAVTVDCGSFVRAGVIRWQNGGLLGLSFDRELDAREVAALAERSKALVARREKTRE